MNAVPVHMTICKNCGLSEKNTHVWTKNRWISFLVPRKWKRCPRCDAHWLFNRQKYPLDSFWPSQKQVTKRKTDDGL